MRLALVDQLRALPEAAIDDILATCTAEELAALRWMWREFWARPDERAPGATEGRGQLPPPGIWTWWASIGGRGSGKTECCSQWVNEEAMRLGPGCIVHLLGQTIDDAIETMVEGVSGLLATAPPWGRPTLISGDRKAILRWPSGARGRVFSAEMARKGRGPQCNRFWIDDPAAFGQHGKAVLEQLLFGFRLNAPDGSPPKGVISSTPIDSDLLEWIMRGTGNRNAGIVYSRSRTDDNRANLSEAFFDVTLKDFEGSELERQERFGEYDGKRSRRVFADVDFAAPPIRVAASPGPLRWMAVWIDPNVSSAQHACEVGIVAVGHLADGRGIVLEDASGHYKAQDWPQAAIDCLERWERQAQSAHFGVETNKSEAQAEALLSMAIDLRRQRAIAEGRSPRAPVRIVTVHSNRSKAERAGLLVAYYRAGNVLHLAGAQGLALSALEGQLRDLTDAVRSGPGRDRADAGVYGLLDVFGILDKVRPGAILPPQPTQAGAFGRSAQEAIAVGPAERPFTFQQPGPPSAGPMPGAFGRSSW